MIRRLALGCVVVGAVAVVGGGLVEWHSTPPSRAAAGVTPPVDVGTVPPVAAAHAPRHTTFPPAGARLELPRVGVDAPIASVALRGHVMQVPRDPRVVGLWRGGAVPGSGRGSVVLVGHVNYAGTSGAFAALPRVRPGDRVEVAGRVGDRRYRVAAVRTYPKTSGIPDAAFAAGGGERLVLITCGGSFDPSTGNYVDNVVVYAVPR